MSLCAGCSGQPGPFVCTHHGTVIKLCASCPARLLAGVSKAEVIKAVKKAA